MRKIEEKLLECFKKRNNFNSKIDSIYIDINGYKSIDYYNYNTFVFHCRTKEDGTKSIYFCLPSYDGKLSNTTKSRINTFLSEYGLKVIQKNYKYFCNDKELKLDTVYFINKDNKEKYFVSE